MSTPQFTSREEMADYAANLLKRRARSDKHARLLKLEPAERHSVIACATLSILAPAPADPLMLLTKRDRERMQRRPAPIANLVFPSPAESPYWVALTKIYRCLLELSKFWSAKTDAERIQLIDREIWKELKKRGRKTKSEPDGVPRDKAFDLERHTDSGNALTGEPSRVLQQEESKDALVRFEELMREATLAYKKTLKNRKHRQALDVAVQHPEMSASAIGARCGVKAATVFRIRDRLEELREECIAKCRTDVPSCKEDSIPITAETPQSVVNADPPNAAEDLRLPSPLDVVEDLHLPETDHDIAENVLNAYARRSESERALDVGIGRRRYTDMELHTGVSGWLPNYIDYAEMAKLKPVEHEVRKRYDETALRYLRQKDSRLVDAILEYLDACGTHYFLRILDEKIRQKNSEASTALAELAELKAERQRQLVEAWECSSGANRALLRAWAAPQFADVGANLDEVLAPTIVGPKSKRGEQ